MDVFELFPVPVARLPRLVGADEVAALRQQFEPQAQLRNQRSSELRHTAMMRATDDSLLAVLAARLAPHLSEFGELLFGERLRWSVKELWVNVLAPGAHQNLHNHANCFISGVLYLTASDASARTVFHRGLGGREFKFSHANARVQPNAFSADQWIAPEPEAGDVILFPSYLLHEVPANRGAVRTSLAFNAIPQALDSWGYGLQLSANG